MFTLQSDVRLLGASYTCMKCDTEFDRKSALDNHVCILQSAPAYTTILLGDHTEQATPPSLQNNVLIFMTSNDDEDPPVDASEFCNVEFGEKEDFQMRAVRLLPSTREKPHLCVYCGAAFALKGVLQNHIRTHTGEKPYKCEECGAAFAQKCSLQRHIRVHTGEKAHKCEECGIAFSEKGNLRKHIVVHSGVKPYVCEQCGAAFSVRNALRKHTRGHTEAIHYPCEYCEAVYGDRRTLKRHLLTKHNDLLCSNKRLA